MSAEIVPGGTGGNASPNTPDPSATGAVPDAGTPPAGGSNDAPAGLPDWLATLSPDLQAKAVQKGWKSPENAIEAFIGAERKLGGDPDSFLKLPKDADDVEGWVNARRAMGVPDSPDGYTLEGIEAGEGEMDLRPALREAAHKTGLSEKQAVMMATELLAGVDAAEAHHAELRAAQNRESGEKQILDWGPHADRNMKLANLGFERMGIDQATVEMVMSTAQARSLAMSYALATSEQSTSFENPGGSESSDPGTLDARIKAMNSDPDFQERLKRNDPSALKERSELYEQRYGNERI